jgi:hypothetical protein
MHTRYCGRRAVGGEHPALSAAQIAEPFVHAFGAPDQGGCPSA